MDFRIDSLWRSADRPEDPTADQRRKRRSPHPLQADSEYEDRYEPSQNEESDEAGDPKEE